MNKINSADVKDFSNFLSLYFSDVSKPAQKKKRKVSTSRKVRGFYSTLFISLLLSLSLNSLLLFKISYLLNVTWKSDSLYWNFTEYVL